MADADLEAGSIEFAQAVRQAAFNLGTAHVELLNNAQSGSKPLLDYILSDKPLSRVDRELLADFLAGELRKRTGRRARSKQENEKRQAIYQDYKDLMEGMKKSVSGKASASVAIDMLCKKYAPLSQDQIEQIVRHRPMRVSYGGVKPRKKTQS